MDDLALKKYVVAACKMAHEGYGFVLADAFGDSEIIQIFFEIPVFTVFQHDIEFLTTAKTVMHLDDEWRGYGFEGCDFALDLFFNVVGEFVDIDHFDSNLHAVFTLSIVDGSACSGAEGL